jgi:predicted neuraminidase
MKHSSVLLVTLLSGAIVGTLFIPKAEAQITLRPNQVRLTESDWQLINYGTKAFRCDSRTGKTEHFVSEYKNQQTSYYWEAVDEVGSSPPATSVGQYGMVMTGTPDNAYPLLRMDRKSGRTWRMEHMNGWRWHEACAK